MSVKICQINNNTEYEKKFEMMLMHKIVSAKIQNIKDREPVCINILNNVFSLINEQLIYLIKLKEIMRRIILVIHKFLFGIIIFLNFFSSLLFIIVKMKFNC